MTDAITEPDPFEELQAAMTAQPVITRPEDLDPADIPQIPYAKTDRVPEVFLGLEARVVAGLELAEGRPVTPAMLRMMRGAPIGDPESPVGRVALFEVMASEGGEVTGWLAAYELEGIDGRATWPVQPQADATDAFDRYVVDFTSAAADDAAFAARESTCRACPPGCNDCTKDQDCECYEHGTTYVEPDGAPAR